MRSTPAPGRVAGERDAVDGAHRGAVDPVGDEAVLGQHLEHPDLDRPPGTSSAQHQGGDLTVALVLVVPSSVSPPLRCRRMIVHPPGPGHLGPLDDEPEDQHQQDGVTTTNIPKTTANAVSEAAVSIVWRGYRWSAARRLVPTPRCHTPGPHSLHGGDGHRTDPGRTRCDPVVGPRPGSGRRPVNRARRPAHPGRRSDPVRCRRSRVDAAGRDGLLDRLRHTGRPRLRRRSRLWCPASGLAGAGRRPRSGGPTPLVVTRDRLTQALTCESHAVDSHVAPRPPTVALACGALMGACSDSW